MILSNLEHRELKSIVTKSNELIQASYRLGLTEQRIILYLVSKIQPTDEEFKTYTLSIKSLHDILGLKGNPKYSELKEITRDLMKKVFQVHMNGSLYQMSWLSSVVYNDDKGTVSLRFDPVLKPFLLELKKNFTSYKYENIVKLRSSYSIRIYELLKQYERLKERYFTVEDFRSILGLENQYKTYGNLKNRVIKPAKKELENFSDLRFDLEEVKTGRKVTGIKFLIEKNDMGTNPSPQNLETSLFINKVETFAQKYKFKISEEEIYHWLIYKEKVLELMEQIDNKKDVKSPLHYINKVIGYTKDRKSNTPADKAIPSHSQLISDFVNRYKGEMGSVPKWSIEEEFKKFMKDAGVTDEDLDLLLEKQRNEIIELTQNTIARNRRKRA